MSQTTRAYTLRVRNDWGREYFHTYVYDATTGRVAYGSDYGWSGIFDSTVAPTEFTRGYCLRALKTQALEYVGE